METIVLEIRSGEGGEDSRLFSEDMAKMYISYARRIGAIVEYL